MQHGRNILFRLEVFDSFKHFSENLVEILIEVTVVKVPGSNETCGQQTQVATIQALHKRKRQIYCCKGPQSEVAPDPECRSRLRQDSAFFFRTQSQKFVKNRTRSHFSISTVAGVCVVIS